LVDCILNHFGLILENPTVNLGKIIVNDMLKALDNNGIVDVSISASINVSKRFG
jgi:hypothetical protein